jgi:hypothetical protein
VDPVATQRLPKPVDPAAPPKRLARAAAVVVITGLFMLFLGAIGAADAGDGAHRGGLVPPEALLVGWLLSLPTGAALLLAYSAIGRRRLRRFERRAGFLPRAGRKALPATGRRTLFRVEYGSRGDRICLMLTRWDCAASSGWRRGAVIEHVWDAADDAVGIGEQRARLTALAETLEEQMDDVRLDGNREHTLAAEALAERQADRTRAHRLAEELARESR